MANLTFYLLEQGAQGELKIAEIEGAHTLQTAKGKAFGLVGHGCSGFLVIEVTQLNALADQIPKATRKVIGQEGANPPILIR